MSTTVNSSTGASIVSSLTGSSIDIATLATNLVEATRAPQQSLLDTEKTAANNKISSIGRIYSSANDMKTAMAAYGDPTTIAFQPTSSDSTKASFAFRPYYTPQSFDISFEVKQLATVNSVTLAGFSSSAPFPTSGTLKIAAGQRGNGAAAAASFDLASYTSLDKLRDAINAGGTYKATIMTSAAPTGTTKYLTISAASGAANQFYVTTQDADGADLASGLYVPPPTRDANGAIVADAGQSKGQDAQIVSGGVTYASATNRFSGLIEGVNIDVKATTASGETVRLSTARDTEKYKSVIRDAVKSYNDLLATIKNEVAYDADIAKRGGLSNVPTAKNFMNQMRRLTTDPISGALSRSVTLAEAGVKTGLDGTLSIDETKLNALASQSPEVLEAIVASTSTSTGVLARMNKLQDSILSTSSDFVKLYNKTNGVDLPKIQKEIDDLGARMDALKTRYLKQFTAMQAFLDSNKAAQDSITNGMAAWTAGLKA